MGAQVFFGTMTDMETREFVVAKDSVFSVQDEVTATLMFLPSAPESWRTEVARKCVDVGLPCRDPKWYATVDK